MRRRFSICACAFVAIPAAADEGARPTSVSVNLAGHAITAVYAVELERAIDVEWALVGEASALIGTALVPPLGEDVARSRFGGVVQGGGRWFPSRTGPRGLHVTLIAGPLVVDFGEGLRSGVVVTPSAGYTLRPFTRGVLSVGIGPQLLFGSSAARPQTTASVEPYLRVNVGWAF